jgi:hypothetical protein
MAFSPNCQGKFAFEFMKKPHIVHSRIVLTYRRHNFADFAKIGKTPSFGGA